MKKFISFIFLCTLLNLPGYASALDATVDSTSANPGDSITINIDFSNNVDEVFGADTTLNWDPAVLVATSVQNGAEFSAFSKFENLATPGEALVTQFLVAATGMSDPAGRVLIFNFDVLPTAPPGASTITLNQLDFGTDTATIPVNGTPTGVVTVLGGNLPPVLNPIGDQNAQVGVQLQFTVSATDPNVGDALTYSATPLPTGATFNAGTQTFTWTPTAGQEGPHVITFGVDDGNGGTDSETITITVAAAANNPPVLDPIGPQSVQVGDTLSFTVTASDIDVGDTLTFGAIPLPAGASFNTTSGMFNWTPVIGQNNVYNVTFSVTDGNGGLDSEVVQITVTPIPGGVHDAVVGSASVNPGDTINIPITFSNNNADVFAVDTTLNWDPAVLQANSVSNGSSFSGFSLIDNLTVPGQAIVSQFGVSPVSVNSGEVLVVNFTVLATAPAGASTIVLNQLDFGTDTITIPVGNVTNGTVTVIIPANNPPVLDPIGNQSVQAGTNLSFTVTASDLDLDTLTFSAIGAPIGASMNSSTGEFSWTPTAGQVGDHFVTFTVEDGNGGADFELVTITVTAVPNNPPVLDPIGNQSVQAGNTLSFTVTASDPDVGDTLTFSAAPLPAGANLTPAGLFTWTPTAGQVGTTPPITFTVSDGNGGSDSEIITITVTAAPNNPPVLDPIGPKTIAYNSTLTFTVTASDPDLDTLTFSGTPLPTGAGINPVTGQFSWTPTLAQEGTHSITFSVSDGNGGVDSELVVITVIAPGPTPQILTPANNSTVNSEPLNITWSPGTNVTQYWLTVGTAPGGTDIYSESAGTNLSASVAIPLVGVQYYINLYTNSGPDWLTAQQVVFNTPDVRPQIQSPSNGSTVNNSPTTISWSSPGGSISEFWLTVGTFSGGANIYSASTGANLSETISIPLSGDQYYINLYINWGGHWFAAQQVVFNTPDLRPQILSPANGSQLFGVPTTVLWSSGVDVQEVWITVGTTSQGVDIFTQGFTDGSNQADAIIPLTGDSYFVNLWVKLAKGKAPGDGAWFKSAEVFYNTPNLLPQFISPAPGSTLNSTPVNLVWSLGVGASQYYVTVGSTPGGRDVFDETVGLVTTAEIFTDLNGGPLYANIFTQIGSAWYTSTEAFYPTVDIPLPIAQIQSPTDGSVITASPFLISWTPGIGVTQYWLTVGTSLGASDLLSTGGTSTSATATVPLNGSTLFVAIYSEWGGNWYAGDPVTYTTSTGDFITSLNVPSIGSLGYNPDSTSASGDSISINTAPVSQQELIEKYNASAAAEMILSYLWWNPTDNPEGPVELSDPNLSDQDTLFNHGQNANYGSNVSINRLDAQGLWAVVQDLDPSAYDWSVSTQDQAVAAVSDLANVLATEVAGADGQPTNVPGAVATNGGYDNWLVVSGVRTSADPSDSAEYNVSGFWVNNPDAQGLGATAYVTAQHFVDAYVLPLENVSADDPNSGKFATLVHTDTAGGQAVIVAPEAAWDTPLESYLEVAAVNVGGAAANVYLRTYDAAEANTIVNSAIAGISNEVAKYDAELAEIMTDAQAGLPLLVQSQNGGYYLVPFADADGTGTVAVAIVGAQTGTFAEVTWSNEPTAYPLVSAQEALEALASETAALTVNGAELELIQKGGNLYQPLWNVYFDGEEYQIDQQGDVSVTSAPLQ